MNNKDFYKILGVNKNASSDDIKKAYRNLSKKYHPDINKSDEAIQKYKDVQEAYETLSNEEKRKTYDSLNNKTSFDNIFNETNDYYSSIFGNKDYADILNNYEKIFNSSNNYSNSGKEDVSVEYLIPLDYVINGGKTTITYDNKSYEVVLPKGIKENQKIKLNENLYVIIKYIKESSIWINNKKEIISYEETSGNIIQTIHVDFKTMILGGIIEVPFYGRTFNVKVPELTQNDTKILLRNQGINGKDLLIQIKALLPTNLTDEQKNIISKFSFNGIYWEVLLIFILIYYLFCSKIYWSIYLFNILVSR